MTTRETIQAKKAKLEELRRLKKARDDAKRAPAPGAGPSTPGPISPTSRSKQFDELLGDLLGKDFQGGSSASPSRPSSPAISGAGAALTLPRDHGRSSLGGSKTSDVGSEITDVVTPVVRQADLVEIEQELFELPQKERITYGRAVQTSEIETEPSGPSEEEIRQRILDEQRAEQERLAQEQSAAELEEQGRQLDRDIEAELRELTEEELTTIYSDQAFRDFVEESSKIMGRALSDAYDYTRDYRIGAESGLDDSEGKRVKKVCAFYDERVTKNRSITDVDWSPKFPELSVASYNKNPAALNEPDGIVAVWNLHMLERPEFVFHSQSDVLSVSFSPFHPNLVFGGSYSGQILLWDTRAKHLPVLKTPLSASGHTHPVYTMQMVGTQNAHNLITGSTDGMVCSWLVDMLAQPQETLDLVNTTHNKTDEVGITALDFPDNETTTFWVGTEEGMVYQANRYDRAGAKAGLNPHDVYKGHAGPVTSLHFHSSAGPVDFGDLFLTSSVDWSVKLWRTRQAAKTGGGVEKGAVLPLYSFEEAGEYVYDVRWHPAHPAVFGAADGAGKLDLWNLNFDTEVPMVSTTVGTGRAINKIAWEGKEGKRVGLGSADGTLYVYDVGEIAVPRESEWTDMQRTLGVMLGGGSVTMST